MAEPELIQAVGKLAEPLTKLVEAIAEGIGGVYRPTGIRRTANAQAEALRIRTAAEIEAMDLRARALVRVGYLDALRQQTIERITTIAAQELPEAVSQKPVTKDWILQFFDCAQDTTDEDMQILWGRILAGEVASPGTFSLRTIQFLKTLERLEAEHFTQLCSLMFSGQCNGGPGYLIAEQPTFDEITKRIARSDRVLDHFAGIGLLAPATGAWKLPDMAGKSVFYFEEEYCCVGPQPRTTDSGYRAYEDWVNFLSLTSMGAELARIAGAKPVEGFVDRLSEGLAASRLGVRFVKNVDQPRE